LHDLAVTALDKSTVTANPTCFPTVRESEKFPVYVVKGQTLLSVLKVELFDRCRSFHGLVLTGLFRHVVKPSNMPFGLESHGVL
jgi:hypothetical protein